MLKEERYDKIIEILDKVDYISAGELSKELYVSLPTIRRDLTELNKRELISRIHGGAKRVDLSNSVMPINFRKSVNLAVKKKLCRVAKNLINEGDVIFIDASTTSMYIADYLAEKNPKAVVTNSILLSSVLINKGIKTYLTGGCGIKNSMCLAGSEAENFVRNFNFDIMFFSCHGINNKNVVVDTSDLENSLRKVVMEQSKKTVFICDSSKFDASAPFNLTPLSSISWVVTDKEKEFFKDIDAKNVIFA